MAILEQKILEIRGTSFHRKRLRIEPVCNVTESVINGRIFEFDPKIYRGCSLNGCRSKFRDLKIHWSVRW